MTHPDWNNRQGQDPSPPADWSRPSDDPRLHNQTGWYIPGQQQRPLPEQPAQPTKPEPGRGKSAWLIGAGAALALLAATVIVLIVNGSKSDESAIAVNSVAPTLPSSSSTSSSTKPMSTAPVETECPAYYTDQLEDTPIPEPLAAVIGALGAPDKAWVYLSDSADLLTACWEDVTADTQVDLMADLTAQMASLDYTEENTFAAADVADRSVKWQAPDPLTDLYTITAESGGTSLDASGFSAATSTFQIEWAIVRQPDEQGPAANVVPIIPETVGLPPLSGDPELVEALDENGFLVEIYTPQTVEQVQAFVGALSESGWLCGLVDEPKLVLYENCTRGEEQLRVIIEPAYKDTVAIGYRGGS